MKLLERLKSERSILGVPAALVCCGIGMGTAFIVMIACGNFCLYSFLLLPRHAPPAFLFYLFYVLNFGLIFYTGGIACFGFCRKGKTDIWLSDLLCAVFLALFYIAFIRMAAFVFALLTVLAAGAMVFLALRRCLGENLILAILHGVLLLYLFGILLLTIAVILLN